MSERWICTITVQSDGYLRAEVSRDQNDLLNCIVSLLKAANLYKIDQDEIILAIGEGMSPMFGPGIWIPDPATRKEKENE